MVVDLEALEVLQTRVHEAIKFTTVGSIVLF
jgi:hypothetical protein